MNAYQRSKRAAKIARRRAEAPERAARRAAEGPVVEASTRRRYYAPDAPEDGLAVALGIIAALGAKRRRG